MVKQPHIALFHHHETMDTAMTQLMSKGPSFTFERVQTIQELVDIESHNPGTFNVILVPSLLHDRASAVTICIQLKSESVTAAIPVIVLSNIRDLPAISTFYGSGADIVMPLPMDSQMLNLQVSSLQRLMLSMREETQSMERDKGLKQAILSALHFVEEALVIFDTNANVVFSNQTAKQLLNLYDDLQSTNMQRAYTVLQNMCQKAAVQLADGQTKVIKERNVNLVKNTGEKLRADMRITSLRSLDGEIIAYCLSIVDISAPGEISNSLMQSERTQFLSLLLASACMQLLNTNTLGSPVNPLSKIDQVFSRENPICSLNSACTSLLEFIDNVASASQMIKINVPESTNIAMKPSHLFLLIGNMIFYCLKSTASKSETTITYRPSSNSFFGNLIVNTRDSAEIDTAKELLASSAIRSEFQTISQNKGLGIVTSFDQAKKIASLYKLQIQEKKITENEIELEIELPRSV